MNYTIPPLQTGCLLIEAQSANLVDQSPCVTPVSPGYSRRFENKLTDIARDYLSPAVNGIGAIVPSHVCALMQLESHHVLIIEPYEGSGAVVLDIDEVLSIRKDERKFHGMGEVEYG